jgi:integrase
MLFGEFVGSKRAVASITPIDVRDFRDTIASLPPGYKKRNDYRSLSVRQAAAKAAAERIVTVSPTTVSKYMSTVSPFFAWLKQDLRVSANPFDGLHVKPVTGLNPRPPFTAEQLNAILSSPLFRGFERDGKEHRPGHVRAHDWRVWIPLLCLFTGARIGEVAQLRIEDIRRQQGWWFLFLRHDPEKGQRIKNGSTRAVAIHPTLERIGFLAHVDQVRRRRPEGPLFPEVEANDRGHIGAKPSRFFRDYLRRIGLKTDRDGLGAHSFRHTMADQLRLAGILDHELGPLVLGHSDGRTKTTAGYGELRQGTARKLREMIEAVQFEGVKFDHLAIDALVTPSSEAA